MTARKKLVAKLFAIPVLMFGFGYLMVPIYDIFCDITGLNGKTGELSVTRVSKIQTDESRQVTVEFMANLNQDTALEFAPTEYSMRVHPGKTYRTMYRAKNVSGAPMTAQAVPSVSPGLAAAHFNKIHCFCFGQQTFAAEEARDMPVLFIVSPDLPSDITTLTLSYTFFDVTAGQKAPPHDDNHEHNDGNAHIKTVGGKI